MRLYHIQYHFQWFFCNALQHVFFIDIYLFLDKNKLMKALIIVDVQNDFMPGGALPVPDGNLIIPYINSIMDKFDLVVSTQDSHPMDHKSFASNHPNGKVGEVIQLGNQHQILWNNHCIIDSFGWNFHSELNLNGIHKNFKKGENVDIDSYSGFFDNDKKNSTGLNEFLKSKNISEVYIVGLALDYCVKATALDALQLGFKTNLLMRGTKAVNIHPNDGKNALLELEQNGVIIRMDIPINFYL